MTYLRDATVEELETEIGKRKLQAAADAVSNMFNAIEEIHNNYNMGLIEPYEAGSQVKEAARIAEVKLIATVS